jgi:uncharacterized protein DUF5989
MKTEASQTSHEQQENELDHQASQRQRGVFGELFHFLVHNKKWWLTPIVLVLLLFGLLVVVGGTGAGPFIYTLF